MSWRPDTYLAYAGHRTRPAYELIARIPLESPGLVYDLGCGPGNSTQALEERWGEARLVGVDSSPEMIEAARRDGPKKAAWELADIADWAPPEPAALIFSNATFQWIPGQERLLPRLFKAVPKGGAFAFQVPANRGVPPHTIIDDALDKLGFAKRIDPASLSRHVLEPRAYYRLLSPLASAIDIWDTNYLQVLSGADPVLNWVKGTALVPIMAALGEADGARFTEALKPRLAAHYPQESDGKTLFPFLRRFIVAIRS